MNKTLYLKDEEGPIWDKARELSGDKLSPVVVQALKQFVAQKEAEASNMERIVIEFDDISTNSRPTAKAFHGRWLISPEESFTAGSVWGYNFAVAITAKEAVVIFHWFRRTEQTKAGELRVYPSFDDALAAPWNAYISS